MEQARKIDLTDSFFRPQPRTDFAKPDQPASSPLSDKVLHVAFPPRDGQPATGAARSPERNYSGALDIVREAASTIRAAETRALEAELRMDELVQRATAELRAAEQRIQEADAKTRAAETRSADLEAKLRDAEDWLARIYETIATELPGRAE